MIVSITMYSNYVLFVIACLYSVLLLVVAACMLYLLPLHEVGLSIDILNKVFELIVTLQVAAIHETTLSINKLISCTILSWPSKKTGYVYILVLLSIAIRSTLLVIYSFNSQHLTHMLQQHTLLAHVSFCCLLMTLCCTRLFLRA